MSVLALSTHYDTVSSIGCSHSYCFYQQLNFTPKDSLTNKQIIPNVPRPRSTLPHNSSLSPIRSQRTPCKNNEIPRPSPLLSTFSSPVTLTKFKRRQTKVSFNEKVVVVCTIFDEEEEHDVIPVRRHSTGDTSPKSILTYHQEKTSLKISQSLKQIKNRLLFNTY